jgi:hypothetical protein
MKRKIVDFVCVGAQKAGTSTFKRTFNDHPEVSMAPHECHFWSDDEQFDEGRGIKRYRQQFDYNKKIVGEKTPDYLYKKQSISRLAYFAPSAKIIVFLRDPVTRAYSGYNMLLRNNRASADQTFHDVYTANSYLLRLGLYAQQLKHLFNYFPREQVWIGITERLGTNTANYYRDLCLFLDIDPELCPPVCHSNVHRHEYVPMDEEDRIRLLEYYQRPNERLFELLGYKIKEWQFLPETK